jgi:hypothetical protein
MGVKFEGGNLPSGNVSNKLRPKGLKGWSKSVQWSSRNKVDNEG